jgi:carboxyl-terminal processing protease
MRSFVRSLGLIGLGLAIGATWQSGLGARDNDDAMELYGTFVDAVEQVQSNYVQPVDRKALLESALHGMLADLDPYSSFMNGSDWKQFQKQVEGSFSGIGVQLDIDRRTGRPVVVAPLVGSPAYAAGVLAGDVILEVNGKSTEDWTRERAIEQLTGGPGTGLQLTVMHPGSEKPQTIALERAIIELDTVMGDHRKPDDSWDFMIDPDRKIGYVRITGFVMRTADDLKEAIEELKTAGVAGLILDLRDDPGGLLSGAVAVSDLFLDQGKIVTTRGRNIRERVFTSEKSGTELADESIPIVVLINQHSASAAEIVAAALQDNQRAKVVGQRSFGKGSVQNLLSLDDGTNHLKLTVATYFRPSEKNIHRFKDAKSTDEWGVSPDPGLEVAFTDEQYVSWAQSRQRRDMLSKANKPKPEEPATRAAQNDLQLAKALEVLEVDLAAKK